MSDFLIQCALCSTNFSKEKEYENHKCNVNLESDVKMEPADDEEEEEQKKNSTANTTEMDSKVKKFEARMKLFANKKKKKPRKNRNVASTPYVEQVIEEEEDDFPLETLGGGTIKQEPIEICEVVNVKDEPMDMADEEADMDDEVTDMQDPLANMEDILGLQDEDYLIENFVEYDEEASGNLEIDESSEDVQDVASMIDNVNAAAQALSQPRRVNPNVGKRIEQTTNKGYECTVCKKRYYLKSKLEEHLKVSHKSPRPYSCNVCNKRFTHKNYVTLHMRVHTGEKPYQCTLCDRSYSHKTSFTIHMRIHRGERPYECTVCGKKCYDKSGLTSHMRSHTKETPYQCECCGRKFTHSKSLLVHRRNHTGEKPYVCPYCGRAFRHWHKHKIHIRLHTGERPYKCKVCNKGFPRNDEVKRHMKSHIGIKSFKCSICGVYCATQASITGHINLHHVNLVTDKKFLPDKTIVENSQSGILGKKIEYQPSEHRTFDSSSYEEFLDRPNTSSNDTPIKTLVTARPMTSAEKVTNKSMTYRQFLNDQEQQLLAKGLKVVSKNGSTYGLEQVSTKEKSEPTENKDKISMDNVFVKINNIKKMTPPTPRATRIILPNLAKGKNPIVLGEEPSKLLLQSVDQSQNGEDIKPNVLNSNQSNQPIIIQTVGNHSSISRPMTFTSSNQGSNQTTSVSTSTSSCDNSILEAALTGNKPQPNENIIVLNKGISGPPNANSGAPLVVLSPQASTQTQQLLLLPGINGGPARLVLLQSSQPVIKVDNNSSISINPSSSSDTSSINKPITPTVIKQEPGVPMVQLHTNPNILNESNKNLLTNKTFNNVRIKVEPNEEEQHVDSILPNIPQKDLEVTPPSDLTITRIKSEPAD